jgi:hypothetical protein
MPAKLLPHMNPPPFVKVLSGIAVLTATVFSSSTASAVIIGDSGTGVNGVGSYQYGDGGEFFYRPTSGPVTNAAYNAATRGQGVGGLASFQTFCLERSEWLANDVDYAVNVEAVVGGGNTHTPTGVMGGDILSRGTVWLYSQFAQGLLANYDFSDASGERSTDAGVLQKAIWALEDELSDPVGNYYYDLALAQFGNDAALAQANAAPGELGVYVLNMTGTSDGVHRQDMLYFDGGGASVPDGGTSLMLLGLALGGVGIFRRFLKS